MVKQKHWCSAFRIILFHVIVDSDLNFHISAKKVIHDLNIEQE